MLKEQTTVNLGCTPLVNLKGLSLVSEWVRLGLVDEQNTDKMNGTLRTYLSIAVQRTITYLGALSDIEPLLDQQVHSNKSKVFKSFGQIAGLSGYFWREHSPEEINATFGCCSLTPTRVGPNGIAISWGETHNKRNTYVVKCLVCLGNVSVLALVYLRSRGPALFGHAELIPENVGEAQ